MPVNFLVKDVMHGYSIASFFFWKSNGTTVRKRIRIPDKFQCGNHSQTKGQVKQVKNSTDLSKQTLFILNPKCLSRKPSCLEHLVHNLLALLDTDEASGVSEEGTNNARSKTGEESLHTSSSVQLLSTIHKALVLTVGLHDIVDLKLGLAMSERCRRMSLSYLHNINGVDTDPVGDTANTSSHELSEHTLVLHITKRLFMTSRLIERLRSPTWSFFSIRRRYHSYTPK